MITEEKEEVEEEEGGDVIVQNDKKEDAEKGYEGVSWELSILQWSRVQEAWEALLAKAVLSGFDTSEVCTIYRTSTLIVAPHLVNLQVFIY